MDILGNALKISHEILTSVLKPGDVVIDATAGNGRDTEFLSNLVSEDGAVFAFDIQEKAISKVRKLAEDNHLTNVTAILESHANMKTVLNKYGVKLNSVSAVMFNLGYLPGGDHNIATRYDTTIEAIRQSLELVSTHGLISIMIYSGGDTGYEEKSKVLEYLKGLDDKIYKVMIFDFINQLNDPPVLAMIEKRI